MLAKAEGKIGRLRLVQKGDGRCEQLLGGDCKMEVVNKALAGTYDQNLLPNVCQGLGKRFWPNHNTTVVAFGKLFAK